MRLYFCGIETETNSFAPWPTGARSYREGGVHRGAIGAGGTQPENLIARELLRLAAADGNELVEGLFATAEPSGPTVHSVYVGFREEILADLRARGPFDVVILNLHGALISTECDDCEGDLLRRVRREVGSEAIIGVELDSHCHLTPAMVEFANVMVVMKEYPHTDFVECAVELYQLCTRTAAGKAKPVAAVFDMQMIGSFPTTTQPMAGLLAQIRAAEARAGILSASFVHGFPWGDTPEVGAKMLVYADADARLAESTARELGLLIYRARDALVPKLPDIESALDQAVAAQGRVVIADTADNAGGGAPSDNVTLLRALLRRQLDSVALGTVWDPISAQTCADAGVGATFALRLGGKCGPMSGDPLDVVVRVAAIRENHDQTTMGHSRGPMGLSVWLQIEGIDVVVNSHRTQTFAPDAFTGLGIDLASKRMIAVKSTNHFRGHFAPLADRIISIATPGALQMNFATLPYRKRRDLNFHPRVADPLGVEAVAS
jgi:microcystin degradation protein MlrC